MKIKLSHKIPANIYLTSNWKSVREKNIQQKYLFREQTY